MYGISAARFSLRASSNARAILSTPVACAVSSVAISGSNPVKDLGQILVTPAAQRQDVEPGDVRGPFQQPCDRVRRLERGQDSLQPGELPEGAQRRLVGDREVSRAAGVPQLRVLGPDARVVEPGGDRVRLEDL